MIQGDLNTPFWDDHPWTPLPTLEGELETDVCVVGLGGSGLSCVQELFALGASVVGLEARSVGSGAAGRNGGLLLAGTAMFYHDAVSTLGRERARSLYALALAELERIAARTPGHVRRTGSLRIAASAEEVADCRRQLEAMRADALPVELYTGPEGRCLLIPTDGVMNPLARCRALALKARGGGATLFEATPALQLSGTEVVTPRGRVRCRSVVVAVDGRLETLLPGLGSVVQTARLQMLAPRLHANSSSPVPSTGVGATSTFNSYRTVASRWVAFETRAAKRSRRGRASRRRGYRGGYSGTGNVVGAILGQLAARLACGQTAPEAALFAKPI